MTPVAQLHEAAVRVRKAMSRMDRSRKLRPINKKTVEALGKVFRQQSKLFLKRFAKHSGMFSEAASPVPQTDHEFDAMANLTREAMQLAIQNGIKEAMLTGSSQILTELSVQLRFDLEDPRAVAYLEEHGAALVAGINETTRDAINTILVDGVKENLSYGQIAKNIKDKFSEFSEPSPLAHIRNRAELIADTELGNAFENTRKMIADNLVSGGIDLEKFWLTMDDDRVSEDCLANENEGWIPVGQDHQSGDSEPLAHPGCRCTELYRRAVEVN